MTDIKIESNVPAPAHHGKPRKYPFENMSVGDSFFVEPNPGQTVEQLRNSILGSSRRELPSRFCTRVENDGVRCWRLS